MSNKVEREYYYTCTIAERQTVIGIFNMLGIEIVDECMGKYSTEFVVKAKCGFQYSVNKIFNVVQDYREAEL